MLSGRIKGKSPVNTLKLPDAVMVTFNIALIS